jgi:hypothetical protein
MIDLDHFDPDKYFPTWYDGHCIAYALALHQLTGWRLFKLYALVGDKYVAAHAVVLSPLGFFDRWGPGADEWFKSQKFLDLCGADATSFEVRESSDAEVRCEYLNRQDHLPIEHQRKRWHDETHDARRNLEMAVPVAEAVLERHWFALARQESLGLSWPVVGRSCSCGDCAICDDIGGEPIRYQKIPDDDLPF